MSESPRKECLQSDLDELDVVISQLENRVTTFAGSPPQESGKVAASTGTESIVETLRRRVQLATARLREARERFDNELAKIQ